MAIQLRRDSAADWTSNDPTLSDGQIGYESDTDKFKVGDGSTAWTSLGYFGAGKQTVYIAANGMTAATTSGAATAQLETTTNKINYSVFDFDTAADEYVHFTVAFPKSWDLGTVLFQVFWESTATGTTGVAWGLQGVAISDNVAQDTAYGTAVVVTDNAQSAAGELYVTAESTAVTIAGTPAADDLCHFRLFRDVSDAADDMTEDARLVGIKLIYTTLALTDD